MSIDQFTEIELANEEWRDIPRYPGYQASNLGRLRIAKGVIVSQIPDKEGYPRASISGRRVLVHHLVLFAFVGDRPKGQEGCHADDVRSNNRLSNLSWGTHAKNYADRVRNGGGNHGERHGMAKLTDADVVKAREMYLNGKGVEELAEIFGVSKSSIGDAVSGRQFKHLPGSVGRLKPSMRKNFVSKSAKLTASQANEIRVRYGNGNESLRDLAIHFVVSKKTILNIVQGKFYATSDQKHS